MPTYDYRCPAGHDFTKFYRKISDATAELPCPECGAVAERRVSGGAGLLFKGSGFYLTDYGKNAHRKSGDAKPAGEAKAEAKGETKSDAKPAEAKPAESKPGASSGTASTGGSTGGGSGAA
ncbi:MAG TPA: zinc ribbon domain-containing protein [Gemmatimonadaceae bacterium]|nr:zinc ribbon domain-containing protein [Gemmatimonadaceae bacterium]